MERKRDRPDGGRPGGPQRWWVASAAALLVVVLVVTAPPVGAAATTDTAETAVAGSPAGPVDATAGFERVENHTDDGANVTKLDVVLILDASESAANNRYKLNRKIHRLDDMFEGYATDIRWALLTYNRSVRIEQPLVGDYDEVLAAMDFPTNGSRENASAAVLAVEDLDLREDAGTVVVLATDEDDDGSPAERAAAISALEDTHFVAISPRTPAYSSCDRHSEPCDDYVSNELRTMAGQADGTWIPHTAYPVYIVDRVGASIHGTYQPEGVPVFETSDATVNRTTVAPGEPVGVAVTVDNTGAAAGTHTVALTSDGRTVAETAVTVPAWSDRTISLAHAFDAPGDYELAVDGETVAVVEVTAPSTGTPTASDPGSAGSPSNETDDASIQLAAPGPGVLATVAALLAAALLLYRYR